MADEQPDNPRAEPDPEINADVPHSARIWNYWMGLFAISCGLWRVMLWWVG